ncbi:MAG: 23S rRNA (adenine(2503)-C(2))-methyltransferase RlmN [Acholeplasmataceae bacterium]
MLIYDLSVDELVSFLAEHRFKAYRANQIWDWLYRQKASSFDVMKNLPEDLRDLLKESFTLEGLELVFKNVSSDRTVKLLYRLPDGHLIETVLMRQHYGNSVCVTTQVGCNIGCRFCASGQLRKVRDLTAGEMVAQVIMTERIIAERISYVVVMGIGEPFDNYKNLTRFLRTLNHPKGLAIGARHITVSTSGIVPKIREYADFDLQVNLAVSLHAPNDEIRSGLMRINRTYPVAELIDAIRYYIEVTNRRVTIEYILIDGVNDSEEVARELVSLLHGLNVYVNLIPYNEVKGAPYRRSSQEAMLAFYDTLMKNHIQVTLRKEQGHDIDAACGQLRSRHL